MHPYKTLPATAFWKPAIADRSLFDVEGLWRPKFAIQPSDKIVTFGSCFAQHIGRALAARGFNWHRAELPPPGLLPENSRRFGYDLFSARTGNIYTTSLLRQWCDWSFLGRQIPTEHWNQAGRIIDPFRPTIEPDGFATLDEMRHSRAQTIKSFANCVREAQIFVFTLGLTESWWLHPEAYEYPTCPGTNAGTFEPARHRFVNQNFAQVRGSLAAAIDAMRAVNPKLRFLLTVSPVPLTATNSGRHVLVATMASKSILRAVADQVSTNRDYVDYFPSYEIINSPVFRGAFFEQNQRTVASSGVDFVMRHFFSALPSGNQPLSAVVSSSKADVACDEELLEAFAT